MQIALTKEEKEFDIENALRETENGLNELDKLGIPFLAVPEAIWIRTILKRAVFAEAEVKRIEEYYRQKENWRDFKPGDMK